MNDDDAKRDRDEALRRVAENTGPWHPQAMAMIQLKLRGFTGTGEDIRTRLIMKGLSHPHHHNAWGALTNDALKKKILVPTGEMRHMRGNRSHARRTPVYRVRGTE